MIYNVTRTDRNIDQAVDQLVGKPFGFIYKLRNGSIGSEPFVIYASSPEFNIDFDSQDYGRTCNLELRPNGIILHFRKKASSFIWPISFDHLTIQQFDNLFLIQGKTLFTKLKPKVKSKKSSPFIKKIIDSKAAFRLIV
ncbi:MAG: hypothetical protein WBK38_03190 [Bacteroidia bacterium]